MFLTVLAHNCRYSSQTKTRVKLEASGADQLLRRTHPFVRHIRANPKSNVGAGSLRTAPSRAKQRFGKPHLYHRSNLHISLGILPTFENSCQEEHDHVSEIATASARVALWNRQCSIACRWGKKYTLN